MKHKKSIALLMAGWIACTGAVHADDSAYLEFPEVAKARVLPGKPLNRLFYFPTRDQPATPAQWGHRFRQVEITSEDGTKLHLCCKSRLFLRVGAQAEHRHQTAKTND